jgi:hypothetical protein
MHSSLCALALCAPQGGGIVSSGQSGIMRPSVRVVVQIISRIRSGKQPEFVTCWIIVCGCRFLTAPNLPRVFTSESAVLVSWLHETTPVASWLHEAVQCADHRNRERRGPSEKTCCLGISCSKLFRNIYSAARRRRSLSSGGLAALECRAAGASLRWRSV